MTFTLIVTGTGGCLLLFISLQSGMCLPCFFHYCLLLYSLFQGHVVYNDFSYMLHPCACMLFSMLLPCLIHEALFYISVTFCITCQLRLRLRPYSDAAAGI